VVVVVVVTAAAVRVVPMSEITVERIIEGVMFFTVKYPATVMIYYDAICYMLYMIYDIYDTYHTVLV
jgi:hypothetical protein